MKKESTETDSKKEISPMIKTQISFLTGAGLVYVCSNRIEVDIVIYILLALDVVYILYSLTSKGNEKDPQKTDVAPTPGEVKKAPAPSEESLVKTKPKPMMEEPPKVETPEPKVEVEKEEAKTAEEKQKEEESVTDFWTEFMGGMN